MNKKWKIALSFVLVVACSFGLVAVRYSNRKITDDAGVRKWSETDKEMVYIDDQAIALAGSASAQEDDLKNAALAVLDLTNQERSNLGLSSLVWSDQLADAALVRAKEIVSKFSHTRPNGTDWWTVNSDLMYGENLARGYSTAENAMKAWMKSPTHKANIVDGEFASLGVAVFKAENGKWYWAQEFGL